MPQFDDQSARRISNTVRGWERRLRGRQQKRARWHGKGGGGGGSTIRFRVVATGPFYGSASDSVSAAECVTVVGEVLDVACGFSGVTVGEEVRIWDPNGCWFNIPIANLETAYGTAMLMKRGGTFEDSECIDTLPNQDPNCFWEVITLCCVEEVGSSS